MSAPAAAPPPPSAAAARYPAVLVGAEARATIRLAGPIVGAQLATVAMNFVDVLMAGQLSAEALAAVAVGGAVYTAVMVFSLGVLLAVPPSVSQLVGAGEMARAGRVARQAGWLALGLAALSVAVMVNGAAIMRLLAVGADIIPTAVGYLRALAWGMPALYGYLVLRYFSEGISLPRPALYIGVLGVALNVVGNTALMYGRWGFPQLGAIGCGYATAIVFWCQFAAMAAYVRARPRYAEARIFSGFEAPARGELAALLRTGLPIGVAVFLEVSLFACAALIMASLGTVAVAGHQVAINFASLTFMVPLGVAMATTVRVGHAVGRSDPDGVWRAGWTGIGVAMLAQALSAFVMLVFPERVARVYTDDPRVLATAAELLLLAGIFQLSDGLQAAAAGALRGLKDTRWPMAITCLAYWVIAMPLGYALAIPGGSGPRGMWIGFIAGLTVAAALLTTRFRVLASRRPGGAGV